MMQRNEWDKKMIVFDMDNTVVQGRFIDLCAERYNFKQALSLLRQLNHDPVNMTVKTARFLKGIKKSELVELASRMKIVPDIIEVVDELKKRSYVVGIISDSYRLITEYIASRVNADFSLANELLYEGEQLTGEVLIPAYFHYSPESSCKHQVCKTNALRYIAKHYEVKIEDCIVVGESDSDLCLVKHAGMGVTWSTNEILKQAAKRHIDQNKLSELLTYVS